MNRSVISVLLGSLLALSVAFLWFKKNSADAHQELCAGPPIQTIAARNQAIEEGYKILETYHCIEKNSFLTLNKQKAIHAKYSSPETRSPLQEELEDTRTLAKARQGFHTRLMAPTSKPLPLPVPPEELFIRSDYKDPSGILLPAYITPDPHDDQKHPAIIWLTGGDTNSLEDFWTPGPESKEQSASAFREAGIIMMFPTLRGGNTNPGKKEYFFGEVDDVLAAAKHLAQQPYVDPNRIYLGGHSTGGTLALLTAETSHRFQAVFAFGPVSKIHHYPSFIPQEFLQDKEELKLRSPIYWLDGISSPTYIIEGVFGNIGDLQKICLRSKNPLISCIPVEEEDHFSVLARVNKVIAANIALSATGIKFSLRPNLFKNH